MTGKTSSISVHIVDTLEQVGDPPEAEAGVDILRRKVPDDRVALLARPLAADVLHEHEVPGTPCTGRRPPSPGPLRMPARGR